MNNVPHINLLPQKRIVGFRARAVARWWVAGGIMWCVVGVFAAGAYSVGVTRAASGSNASTVVSARLEAKHAEKQALTTHVTDLRRRVDAARAVGHHPDWSVMLRHLAVSRPPTLIMSRCELKRTDTTTRTPASDGKPESSVTRTRLTLVISGLAEQMSDVHAFIGKVEGARVFDSVRMGETAVVAPSGEGQPALTRYTIQCELEEPQQGGAQ